MAEALGERRSRSAIAADGRHFEEVKEGEYELSAFDEGRRFKTRKIAQALPAGRARCRMFGATHSGLVRRPDLTNAWLID